MPPTNAAAPIPHCEETPRAAINDPRWASGTSSVISAVSGPWRNAAPRLVKPKITSSTIPQEKKGIATTATASNTFPPIAMARFPQRSESIPPSGEPATATSPPSIKTQRDSRHKVAAPEKKAERSQTLSPSAVRGLSRLVISAQHPSAKCHKAGKRCKKDKGVAPAKAVRDLSAKRHTNDGRGKISDGDDPDGAASHRIFKAIASVSNRASGDDASRRSRQGARHHEFREGLRARGHPRRCRKRNRTSDQKRATAIIV